MRSNMAKLFIAYRQKHDVSQRDLGKEIGISASTLCRIEKGEGFDHECFIKILIWMKGVA